MFPQLTMRAGTCIRSPDLRHEFKFQRVQLTRQTCGHMRVRSLLSGYTTSETHHQAEDMQPLHLITAIKTPYLENGKFDLPAFDRIVEQQIQNGVEGLIIGGTTGEGHLMTWDEHIMLIGHTVVRFGNRIKVIGNTGSNSTREALHATEQGFAVGMHAALHINPYYGKTSKQGLIAHFNAAMDEGPAIIYNVPGRTGQDITEDVVFQLAKHENFVGIKECTGNARIQTYSSKGIRTWSGNDDECHTARHEFGGNGVISVTSNLIPGLFKKLMTAPEPELNESLQPLIKWLFHEPNPICVDTAMAMCGLVRPVFRLPYYPVSREQRVIVAKLLEQVAGDLPGVKDIRILEDEDFTLIKRY